MTVAGITSHYGLMRVSLSRHRDEDVARIKRR